jgi:23S rRNA (adenine2503-C2)-methyltransferase
VAFGAALMATAGYETHSDSRPQLSFRDLLELYRPDLASILTELKQPAFRYGQVYEHLTHHPTHPFAEATALGASLRDALDEVGASALTMSSRVDDTDGTTKLLLADRDGAGVECVVMRYRRRNTVCVSTQIGCALGCAFCVTGSIGFRRDLSAAEIVDQVGWSRALLAEQDRASSNVVFMGMGEPLHNLDAVLASIKILKDPRGWGIGQRSLAVSTVGIPAGIRRLAKEEPQVNLALSLHAADNSLRSRLVPANRRYPLAEVIKATDDHFSMTHRKLFVEYVLLAGVNDSPKQAAALADLLRGRVVAVNLIPWNPGCGEFKASEPDVAAAFLSTLQTRGIEATIRESRGRNIEAACGQLAAGMIRRGRRPSLQTSAGTTEASFVGSSAGSRPKRAPASRRREGR